MNTTSPNKPAPVEPAPQVPDADMENEETDSGDDAKEPGSQKKEDTQ